MSFITGAHQLSNIEFLFMSLGLVALCYLIGWILDLVLDHHGFGVIGNTILIGFSIVLSIYMWGWFAANVWAGRHIDSSLSAMVVVTTALATVLILSIGLLKRVITR